MVESFSIDTVLSYSKFLAAYSKPVINKFADVSFYFLIQFGGRGGGEDFSLLWRSCICSL